MHRHGNRRLCYKKVPSQIQEQISNENILQVLLHIITDCSDKTRILYTNTSEHVTAQPELYINVYFEEIAVKCMQIVYRRGMHP
jgi:hypothetical protein